jgi:FAD/FMN-containing dehydrogenase
VKKISSWGKVKPVKYQKFTILKGQNYIKSDITEGSLVFGNGRSYGDVCFAENTVIFSNEFNRILSIDKNKGIVSCQSGLLLHDLFKKIIPEGWFMPVVPGTQFITIGGAVANDIHGKNHHKRGSFGNHIIEIKLQDSQNNIITCSKNENYELFKATIGGLGLTGVILEVKIQLIQLSSTRISQNTTPFYSFGEYLKLNKIFELDYEYTVAWVDFGNAKDKFNGIFISGNHTHKSENLEYKQNRIRLFPITPPISLINNLTIAILNKAYFIKNKRIKNSIVKINNFFFPLDIIHDWNKAYGKRGLIQYQFVLPLEQIEESVEIIQKKISESKIKPSLTVIKTFGNIHSEGYLSFPRNGVSFAVDFPNKGERLLDLLSELDKVIFKYKGALYPAKDSRMNNKMFNHSFPNFQQFLKFKDPKMNSKFFERIVE